MMNILKHGCWALGLLAAACGAEPGVTDRGTPTDGGADTGVIDATAGDLGFLDGGPPADTGDRFDAAPIDTGIMGGTFDLTGTWTSRVINSQCFDGTLGMDTVQITTISRITVAQTGNTAMTTTLVCSVELTPYLSNQTTYPPAAISAIVIPPQTSALSGTTIGATYVPVRRVSLLGWTATGDPASEMLPTMDTDGRVFDADGDGNPGVTFQVEGTIDGEVYIANRNIVDINAVVTSSDRIEGTSHTVQEQKVLAAMPNLLRFNTIMATPNPDVGSSTFTMVRLPGGVDTCAAIVAMQATLFPAPSAVVPCP